MKQTFKAYGVIAVSNKRISIDGVKIRANSIGEARHKLANDIQSRLKEFNTTHKKAMFLIKRDRIKIIKQQ